MKIFSLHSGIDLGPLRSNYGDTIEGVTGDENDASIANGIVDSDLFICDLELLKGNIIREIALNKHHILSRIKSGGILLCFAGRLQPGINIHGNNYEWLKQLGANISPENLSGKDFMFYGEQSFIKLLNKRVNDFSYKVIFNSQPGGPYFPIAKNKGNHCMAYYASPGSGHIFILPRPKDKDEFVKYFIEKILPRLEISFEIESGSKEPIPESIETLIVSGQDELRVKIKKQEEKVKKEQVRLEELRNKYSRLEEWKELLWQTGTPLENIVKRLFNLLGLELKRQEIDLVGEYKGKEVFIEVKGNTGCIDHKNNFRQIQERKHYNSKDPKNTVALLVGNAFRLEPLDKRPPTKDHSLFAKSSIGIAEETKIGLISTIELFNIVNDILNREKKTDKSKILYEILNCHGIYTYKKNC